MKEFMKRILAPLDGSPLAACILPHLVTLAETNDATIVLLRVLDKGTPAFGLVDPLAWQLAKAEAQAYLDELGQRLAGLTGSQPEVYVLEGAAAPTIVGFIEQHQIDIIVLSSHGQSGISAWNTSGVAQKVIHRAGRSIFLTRAYSETGCDSENFDPATYHRILVPLDGSQRAESVLPVASALAQQHNAELHLVHVVVQPEMLERMPLTEDDHALASQIVERNRIAATLYFEQIQSRLPVSAQTHIVVGSDVATTLHEFAASQSVDIVMLTAHGHTGQSRWPYGSITSGFIAYGDTPLFILQDLSSSQIQPTNAQRLSDTLQQSTRRVAVNGETHNIF
jgi:nucleotide-binding universal stress UspA family protein